MNDIHIIGIIAVQNMENIVILCYSKHLQCNCYNETNMYCIFFFFRETI